MDETPGKNSFPRKRIIGILGTELYFEIPVRIFNMAKELACKNDIQIYYLTAHPLQNIKDAYYESNILYNFISRNNLDGLLIMSNILLTFVAPDEFMEKIRQYHALPKVSLGMDLPDIPSILIDNESGIYAAVSHLIEVHHRTRIGFLRGPLFHPEAQLRFKAYARAMLEHNLAVNEALIFQGDFHSLAGTLAIKELIEKRGQIPGRDIDALVCANDYMAIMAQMELLERGFRIPGDIAIVGFDDIASSKCLIPSLSSINSPFDKMTARAFELLMDLCDGKQVPKTVIIPTEFMPRASCGCVSMSVPNITPESPVYFSKNSFIHSINTMISSTTNPQIHIWKDALAFLPTYDFWQKNNQENNQTANFTRTAYSLLGKTAKNSLIEAEYEKKMNSLGVYMSSTLDLSKLMKILMERLPELKVRRCYLNLYENPADYNAPGDLPPWSNMLLAFREQDGQIVREELPPGGLRFPTYALIPREIIAKHGQMSWVVAALHFDREQIGFILLDSDSFDTIIYFFIRTQLSSRLKSVLLLKGYQDHSRKLAEANAKIYEFNKQLKNENLHFKTEMDVARSIQTALLPINVHNIHPDFEMSSLMIPATEVGGDYFDIAVDEQQQLWIGIGDVSGHGLKAGMIMMIAQSAQTTITADNDVTPRDVIIKMNSVLFRSVTHRMKQNQYMTCSILKYLKEGRFQYAGMHLNFLIYRKKQKICEEIVLNGIWLNITKEIDKFTENSEFELNIGDVLVLYTDGITEVFNKNNQLLDTAGLKKIIVRHGTEDINDMLHAIKEDVEAWSVDTDKDDMSLVLIRRIH